MKKRLDSVELTHFDGSEPTLQVNNTMADEAPDPDVSENEQQSCKDEDPKMEQVSNLMYT